MRSAGKRIDPYVVKERQQVGPPSVLRLKKCQRSERWSSCRWTGAGAYRSCSQALSGIALLAWNKNIPPRYAIRLDDLRAWHVIFASCAACGRRTHIDARLLRHGRAPYTRLLDLERKLRCSSCGNHQGNAFSVSMAPRN